MPPFIRNSEEEDLDCILIRKTLEAVISAMYILRYVETV